MRNQLPETERLRARIDAFVARLCKDYPSQKVSRALIAKGCDVSIASDGAMSAIWKTQRATDLLAGHWTAETVRLFVDAPNH